MKFVPKYKVYFFLMISYCILTLLCQSIWIFSSVTEATITSFDEVDDESHLQYINTTYVVNAVTYKHDFLRNNYPRNASAIEIRYLLFAPSYARVNTFVGFWEGILIVQLIISIFTSMVFLVPNDTIPKVFAFQKKKTFPWIKIYDAESL